MMGEIDEALRFLRSTWNEYLVEIEDSSQLQADLDQLFQRLTSENCDYSFFLEEAKDQLEGLN